MNKLEKARFALGLAIMNFLVFGVLPNLVSDYIKIYYVHCSVLIGVVVLFYLLVGGVARRAAKKARATITMVQDENLATRKGLIVFSSPGSRTTAAENAIKAHLKSLEQCWIIVGPDRPGQKPSSRENAEQIIKTYRALKPELAFHMKELDDEHDPQKAFHVVQAIYHEAQALRLSEEDMIADYTGGTASMTAGMVLACSASEHRDAQYMKPKEITPTGVATPATEAVPVLVDLRFGVKP